MTTDPNFLKQISDHLYNNIDDPTFSIDLLCKELRISRSHLHRKIKAHTGLSTSLYIRQLRLTKAMDMLEHTTLNISEIAYSVGINSPQNFSKYFTKEYGKSPSEFRRNFQEASLHEYHNVDEETSIQSSVSFPISYRSIAIALIALIGISLAFISYNAISEKDDLLYGNSIAILPFKIFKGEQYPYLGYALTEDIINRLSVFNQLKTISRTSSFQYLDTEKSSEEIGEELDVRYLVEGSIQENNDQLKVNVQLFEAETGTQVWSNSYQRKVDDIFNIQSELTEDIALSLGTTISKKEEKYIDLKPTSDFKAYNLLTEARNLIRTRKGSDLEQAVSLCDSAIIIDSEYADAFAYRSTAKYLLRELKYQENSISIGEIESDALHALKYEEANSQAYATLGNLYTSNYQWKQAMIAYEIALENQPNNAVYNYWYSLTLRSLARLEEAIEYNLKAKVLDPFHPVIHGGYIATCMYADRYDEAEKAIEEDRNKFGDSFIFQWLEGDLFQHKEDYSSALKAYEKALAENPGMKSVILSKVTTQGKMGQKELVLKYINTLDDDNPIDLHRKAVAYAAINDFDNGLSYFIKAAEKGFIASDFMVDQTYRPFRDTPEMQDYLMKFDFIE